MLGAENEHSVNPHARLAKNPGVLGASFLKRPAAPISLVPLLRRVLVNGLVTDQQHVPARFPHGFEQRMVAMATFLRVKPVEVEARLSRPCNIQLAHARKDGSRALPVRSEVVVVKEQPAISSLPQRANVLDHPLRAAGAIAMTEERRDGAIAAVVRTTTRRGNRETPQPLRIRR